MNPIDLKETLSNLVKNEIKLSAMLWGAPGIGKSSIVAQVAAENALELIDVRLSQLAPTDLRGLPVPEDGIAKWYAPEFLPREGNGILFLDEFNLSPPAIQGIAQQLILDRQVGSYTVPSGWFIWAAGNRKEDAAAVAEMPSPLANRFLHFDVSANLKAMTQYALSNGWHSHIIGFLQFKPELLHKLDKKTAAWPSPRSWAMANTLYCAKIPTEYAIGGASASAFEAYVRVCADLPEVAPILNGTSLAAYPANPELRFAITTQLALAITNATEMGHTVAWVKDEEQELLLFNLLTMRLKPDERTKFWLDVRRTKATFPQLQNLLNLANDLRDEL
jgi:MoxR-like ATPase